MTALIEARGVSKRFRQHKRFPGLLGALKTLVTSEYTEVQAVSDIGFDIAAGEAVGYLGPNSAGKSTMIKMIRPILRLLTRHFLSAFILAALLAAPLVILHTLHEKTAFDSGLLIDVR